MITETTLQQWCRRLFFVPNVAGAPWHQRSHTFVRGATGSGPLVTDHPKCHRKLSREHGPDGARPLPARTCHTADGCCCRSAVYLHQQGTFNGILLNLAARPMHRLASTELGHALWDRLLAATSKPEARLCKAALTAIAEAEILCAFTEEVEHLASPPPDEQIPSALN